MDDGCPITSGSVQRKDDRSEAGGCTRNTALDLLGPESPALPFDAPATRDRLGSFGSPLVGSDPSTGSRQTFRKRARSLSRGETNGSAGMNQTRTFWDHSLILAIPFSRWGAKPYIVDPILFPSGVFPNVVSESCDQADDEPVRIHPYQQACL